MMVSKIYLTKDDELTAVVLEDGNYSDEEKNNFMQIAKNGASFFFKYARLGGLKIA